MLRPKNNAHRKLLEEEWEWGTQIAVGHAKKRGQKMEITWVGRGKVHEKCVCRVRPTNFTKGVDRRMFKWTVIVSIPDTIK